MSRPTPKSSGSPDTDSTPALDKLGDMSEETLAVDRALALLEQATSLGGVRRAEAFEQFHDALAAALDEEPGD